MYPPTSKSKALLLLLVIVVISTCAELTFAAGLLTPKQSTLAAPHIRSHHVNVVIENGYARTEIDQVFFNPNGQDIEAVYSFPVPEKAAVGEFTYWIDEQPITGEVVEKARAREIYETEKAQGNETALVEKNEYKTFESTVYPVRAKQDVKIRLVYWQPVHVDSAVGRYVYPLEDGGVDDMQQAFWDYQETVTESFSFRVKLRSSYPLDEVRLPTHPGAVVTQSSSREWEVLIGATAGNVEATSNPAPGTQSPAHTLNEDIVLYWRLQPGLPGGVDMLTYREAGKNEGTFMLTLTPGDDLDKVIGGRDWIFVLDFSGSMQGKYASLIDGVNRALEKLRPEDRFRIFLFNNRAWEITNGFTEVNEQQIRHYSDKLDSLQPEGGTNLYAGLQKGIRALEDDRLSGVILVTDGVANVGTTERKSFLKLLNEHDVRLFTFVMGNSANRPLLEGMTDVSDGFAMNVSNGDDVYGHVLLAASKLTHMALRDIQIDIDGVKVRDLTPRHIGSIYRGDQLIVMGHYYGDGDAELTVKGNIGDRPVSYDARLVFPQLDENNPALERLWAFATVEAMQNRLDYLGDNPDTRQALVDVAVKNSLVTNHTSMIVVRDERFQHYQVERSNRDRVEKELAARQLRSSQPVVSHSQQVGQSLNQPRAYPSSGKGGGAFGPWAMLLLIGLMFLKRTRV